MANLTQDNDLAATLMDQGNEGPLVLNEVTYSGSLLSVDPATGCLHRLVAGEHFAGIALRRTQTKDWSLVGAASGSLSVRYANGTGFIVVNSFSGLTQLDAQVRRKVYATDDQTFTLIASNPTGPVNATYIGEIFCYLSSTSAVVRITTDEVLGSSPAARGVETLGTGTQTLVTRQTNKVLRVDGTVNQSVVLPLMALWIGKYVTIENAKGGGTITISCNSTDNGSINGGNSVAQTATSIGKTTVIFNTGTELVVMSNT